MILDELTPEEIKDIMKQLLFKVETDKSVVEKELKHRTIYKYNGKYCINFYNGYEYKVCAIDNHNADISSESLSDNVLLTKFYKKLLSEVTLKKEQVVNL